MSIDDKVDKKDWKYMLPDPEPGFSPEKNKKTIENSIKKYEAMRKKKFNVFMEGLEERNDALMSWLSSLKGSEKPIDQYLGRKWMAYFRGEQIKGELEQRLKAIRAKHPNIII